jgi:hypothetical protein
MAVFAPMPRASVQMAAAANPGSLRSIRHVSLMSWPMDSTHRVPRTSRQASFA